MTIKFRPHHFLCTLGFQGKGYSPKFVSNYQTIVDQLTGPQGDQIPITVVEHTDSICAPCPNKRDKLCTTQDKITALDQSHSEILNIQPGDVLTWGEAKQKIAREMSVEKFNNACSICSWKALGVCEEALRKLIET
jgi:uncharacterized protein